MHDAEGWTSSSGDGGASGGAGPDALLTGSLPCVTCRYELKGLSVRDVCPECGTAVRAAILSAVDPLADELAPMRWPSFTGVLIIAWALSAAIGVWLILTMRITDGLRSMNISVPEFWWGWHVSFALLVISGVGSLGFLMPTARTRWWSVLSALCSTLAYVPFFYALVRIRAIDMNAGPAAAFFTLSPDTDRILWRMLVGGCLVVIFLGIRPNARELVRRSIAMRTGRVDRQTLLAMASTCVVMMLGDILRLAGASGGSGVAVLIGSLIILIATVFLGFGMALAVVDGLRIRRSLRMGPRRMRDLVGGDPGGLDGPD